MRSTHQFGLYVDTAHQQHGIGTTISNIRVNMAIQEGIEIIRGNVIGFPGVLEHTLKLRFGPNGELAFRKLREYKFPIAEGIGLDTTMVELDLRRK